MNQFNLYDDESKPSNSNPEEGSNTDLLITLDFSKETFGEMVEKVRTIAQNVPESLELNLFILSGYNPHPDSGLFLEYIKSLKRPFNIYVRGIVHLEFMKLLSFPNLWLIEGTKLRFDPTRLQEFQTELLNFPNVFRIYFQRYIDEYHKYKSEVYFDMTEMKTLGFNFQIY